MRSSGNPNQIILQHRFIIMETNLKNFNSYFIKSCKQPIQLLSAAMPSSSLCKMDTPHDRFDSQLELIAFDMYFEWQLTHTTQIYASGVNIKMQLVETIKFPLKALKRCRFLSLLIVCHL